MEIFILFTVLWLGMLLWMTSRMEKPDEWYFPSVRLSDYPSPWVEKQAEPVPVHDDKRINRQINQEIGEELTPFRANVDEIQTAMGEVEAHLLQQNFNPNSYQLKELSQELTFLMKQYETEKKQALQHAHHALQHVLQTLQTAEQSLYTLDEVQQQKAKITQAQDFLYQHYTVDIPPFFFQQDTNR
ncbi:hypothetical protein [Salsuginibacillus kocurii]|uniref:hypothetical protein n=1 Tax=Salsuginibacillus kocurii TaxID=427078 RepID=UPI00036F1482|nr:hypothetical protein [Salsuginibacillus kocurii]